MNKMIILYILTIFVISCAGSNATTMEYRSATTAVRSERDLDKGERYALKALDMVEHANDARVAYFLAIEIYKPRKNWVEMNRMLDIAIARNPEQTLDRPFRLDDGTVVKTISESVPIYKEQIWMNIFNQTVDLVDAGKNEEALEKINFAKTVLEKVDNFITASLLYIQMDDIEKAKDDLNNVLKMDPNNVRALQIFGDLEFQNSNLTGAMTYYKKALKNTKDQDTLNDLNKSLIFIYVELENYDQAITLSENLLSNNLDDPDIFFNVGVIYQRLASKYYDKGFEDYNAINASENIDTSAVKSAYKNFKNAYEMTQQALNYFMDSSMVEENENNSTDIAIKEMRRLRKNLKEIYIPSMEKISTDNNIELN